MGGRLGCTGWRGGFIVWPIWLGKIMTDVIPVFVRQTWRLGRLEQGLAVLQLAQP